MSSNWQMSDASMREEVNHDEVIAPMISFLLETLFGEQRSDQSIATAKSLFLPIARITVVPRNRPTLARSVQVDRFMAKRSELFGESSTWMECFRTSLIDEVGETRIHTNIAIPSAIPTASRTMDLLFVLHESANSEVSVRSLTVVYDEGLNGGSPITLFS